MVKIGPLDPKEVGQLFGLLVHDLRNPTATISANVDFLQEVGLSDEEATEALADVRMGVSELKRGLDLVAWFSRWLMGDSALEPVNGDAGVFISRLEREETPVPVEVTIRDKDSVYCKGAQAAAEMVGVLLHNTRANAPGTTAQLTVYRDGDDVVVELADEGQALAKELRELAFTMGGQKALKGRADGRYSRFAGMLAVAVAAHGVGATIEADEDNGHAVFRIRLRPAPPSRPPSP